MPINFPSNPTTNQNYTFNNSTWVWTGSRWEIASVATTVLSAASTNVVPATDNVYNIGSTTQRWRNLSLAGNINLGNALVTSSQTSVVLPTGSTIAGTAIATSTDVATGGGPKITNVQIADGSWVVLDDTAVDTAGGNIIITGTNFVSGCLVYFNQTPANSVAFVSTTNLRVTVPALSAGTYVLYVINPDGGTAIRVPGVTASANPAWQTASNLGDQSDGAITLSLVATEATSYTLTSGSLPPGLSLNSSTGTISGTVTGVTVDTSYTFTVRATDAQNQDSPRTFSVNIAVSDPYFRLTTLLLSGSAVSANTVVRDSSTNNFNLTVFGDARASNFTPYGTGWSVYFDGSGDYLSIAQTTQTDLGANNFTVEMWVYFTGLNDSIGVNVTGKWNSTNQWILQYRGPGLDSIANQHWRFYFNSSTGFDFTESSTTSVTTNTWYHIAMVRNGSNWNFYRNGVQIGSTGSSSATVTATSDTLTIGTAQNVGNIIQGYISNYRLVVGTAVYTANFVPPTAPLTAVTNTVLLTCHTNRFADGSINNLAITRNGDAAVRAFNPFNLTNTGVNGSMYFDGTGDYVQANGANLAVGTGDFTLECYVYTWVFSGDPGIMQIGPSAYAVNTPAYTNSIGMSVTLGGNIFFYNNGTYTTGNVPIQAYTWNHLAICRSGTTHRLFVNGVQAASVTDSSNYTGQFFGAGVGYGTNYPFTGYITNIRLVRGTALYTAAFTPPAAPLTAIANTQLLTLQYDQPHNNHTFLDSSSNQFLITRSGNASQGIFSPFGPGRFSRYFVNYESYNLNSMLTGWGLGLTTTELWLNSPSRFGIANAHDCVAANGRYALEVGTDRKVYVTFTTSTGSQFDLSTTNLVTFNQWNHIAIQIDARTNTSAVITVYINGVGETFAAQNMSTQTSLWANPTVGRGRTGCFSYANDTGYVSDYRIVKDEFVYTGNFTPPTAPLAVSGALSANAYPSLTNVSTTWTSANCIVLMYSASSNRPDNIKSGSSIVLTKGTDTRTTNFSPYQNSAVYSPVIHGGSAYFDGSGDSLTTPTVGTTIGTGDYCLEGWVYTTNATASFTAFILINTSSNYGIYLQVSGNAGRFLDFLNPNSNYVITGGTVRSYEWVHLVGTRQSGNMRLFVNGVLVAYQANNNYNYGTAGTIQIPPAVAQYLSGIRVNIGSVPSDYQTSVTTVGAQVFNPPTTPVTATTNTSLLLNFTDAAILDSTGRNVLETVADARTSSVVTKFTGGSMYFDGTGDWTIIPTSPNFGYGTGDFTIEFWMYWTGAGSQTIVSNLTNSSSSNPHLWLNAGVLVYFTAGADRITGSSITANQWYHVALSRDSGSTKLFVNGTQSGSTYADSNNYGTTAPFGLGTYWNNGTPNAASVYSGYIADLRITRGYARYTANFTAPTSAFRLK